jgi:hypothetical protein
VVLPPGARANRCFSLWQCAGAQDTLKACADGFGELSEDIELDNCREEVWSCDTTAPVITSGPQVSSLGETSAQICWDTDEASTSEVRYDTRAGQYRSHAGGQGLVSHHCITLTGLSPATGYHFVVESADAGGNRTAGKDAAFRTSPRADSNKPTAALRMPARLRGRVVIAADAEDDQGVEQVLFMLDGKPRHTDYTAPFEWSLDTTEEEDGPHDLRVIVTDAGANTTELLQVTEIRNAGLPESPVHVEITSPYLDDEIAGEVYVVARVTHDDDSAIDSVELVVDGTQIASRDYSGDLCLRRGPTGATWTVPCGDPPLTKTFRWDAAALTPGGRHSVRVNAVDSSGNTGSDWTSVVIAVPDVSITRNVVRLENYFQVTLTIRNHGFAEVQNLHLTDSNTGFQGAGECALDTGSGFGDPVPCETRYYSDVYGSTLDYTHASLGGGDVLRVRYDLVPILRQSEWPAAPAIGNSVRLTYRAGGSTYTADDPIPWSDSDEISDALAAADYLLVTYPARLIVQVGLDGGRDVMNGMARLARAKHGALGCLGDTFDSFRPSGVRALFRPGGAWADRLHPVFSDPNPETNPAYLLIVGETEVVPSLCDDVSDLDMEWAGGGRPYVVERSDNYYADTVGGDSKPDLIVGRIIGDTADGILKAINASLDVHAGLGFGRTSGTVLSGYDKGSGDDFEANAEYTKSDLNGQSIGSSHIAWNDWLIGGDHQPATHYDGFAVGDVDGDGVDEFVLADDETGVIEVFEHEGHPIADFAAGFTRSDGLALGDIDGDGVDEIVVAENGGGDGELRAYEPDGGPIDSLSAPFAEWDGLAVGNVHDTAAAEIVTISASTDEVRIYELDAWGDLDRIIGGEWTAGVDFTRFDGFAVGHVRPDWAGDQIVVIRDDDQAITIYNEDGLELASLSDLDGDGSRDTRYTRYDGFDLGDVDADGEDEMLVLTDEDDALRAVYWDASGAGAWKASKWYNRRLNEWFSGARTAGSDTAQDGFALGDMLSAGHDYAVILHNRNGGLSEVHHLLAWGLTLNAHAVSKLADRSDTSSVIAVTGHGNTEGPSPMSGYLSADWGTFDEHPLVMAMSCLTGDYDDPDSDTFSYGDSLFDHEAGGFIGSTETSPGTENDAFMREFFESRVWDLQEMLPARAFARYERWRADDDEWWNYDWWRYWVLEYNYYGDPRFGTPDIEPAVPPEAVAARAASGASATALPPPTVQVSLPDLVVTQETGLDRVEIPSGGTLLVPGRPQVPTYAVSVVLPVGYRVEGVTLTQQGGVSASQGLVLPPTVQEPDSAAAAAPRSAALAGEEGWFPEEDYRWHVVYNLDGSGVLWVDLYPFRYNSLTTDARYSREWAFAITYAQPGITLTDLGLENATINPGGLITFTLGIANPGQSEDVFGELTVLRYPSGNLLEGLPLRLLQSVSGASSAAFAWDSADAPEGAYDVRVVLRTAAGQVLDSVTRGFTLEAVTTRTYLPLVLR